MKKKPLISVLMPAYNAELFVAGAIKCILNQTYSNIELLIADDFSTDKTKSIIQTFKDERIKTVYNCKNLGYLATWNKLIKNASGDYITFMDADDLSALNRVELLAKVLIENENIDVVGSNYTRINTKNEPIESSLFPSNHDEIKNGMPEKYFFIGSALMIRKNVYEQIGGYNEFFNRMGAEDHYWLYLVLEKFKIVNIKEALYYYRFNENSVSVDISNNPSKINAPIILAHLIYQRKKSGTDDLQEGKIEQLKMKLATLNKPFEEDTSYYFYYVAKRRFYEGHKNIALRSLFRAIKKSPFRVSYYRDFMYFLFN